MKVRLINSLEGVGLGLGLASPNYRQRPPHLMGLGQLPPGARAQAADMLNDFNAGLSEAESVLLSNLRQGRVGLSTYEGFMAQHQALGAEIDQLIVMLDSAETEQQLRDWTAAADAFGRRVEAFLTDVETRIGVDIQRRPARFIWLTVGAVVVLGGAAAIIVARTTRRRRKRKRRR